MNHSLGVLLAALIIVYKLIVYRQENIDYKNELSESIDSLFYIYNISYNPQIVTNLLCYTFIVLNIFCGWGYILFQVLILIFKIGNGKIV